MSTVTTDGGVLTGVSGLGTSISIANAAGATGPSSAVFMTDAGMQVDSLSGTTLQTLSLSQFWANAGIATSVTKQNQVIYDSITSRWFVTANDYAGTSNNQILLAVSANSDPTSSWKAMSLSVTGQANGSGMAARFPTLGIDANGVYVAADLYSVLLPALSYRDVYALPKADLLWSGSGAPSQSHLNFFSYAAPFVSSFSGTIRPTVNFKANRPQTASYLFVDRTTVSVGGNPQTAIEINYLVWSQDAGGNYNVATISAASRQFVQMGYNYLNPAPVYQPGSTSQLINAGDGRLLSAGTIGGYLYTVIPTVSLPYNRDGGIWVQMPVTAPFSITNMGTVASTTADILYPTISANLSGNIAISYSEVSTSEYLSEYVTGRLTTDGYGVLDAPVETVAGSTVYTDGTLNIVANFGTSSVTVTDPSSNNEYWGFQAIAAPTYGANNWILDTQEFLIS